MRGRSCWAKERDPVRASVPRELVNYKLRTCSLSTDWEQWTCSPYGPAEPPMLRDPWWQDIQEQGKSEHGHNKGISCCLKFDVSWLPPAPAGLCVWADWAVPALRVHLWGDAAESQRLHRKPGTQTSMPNRSNLRHFKIGNLIQRICIKSNQTHQDPKVSKLWPFMSHQQCICDVPLCSCRS